MMRLLKRSDSDQAPTQVFEGLVDSITRVFGPKVERPVQWAGLILLAYYLNPFNLFPPVRPGTRFFYEFRRFADFLCSAHRGGLFRRGDE